MQESNPSIIFSLKFSLTNEPYPKSKVGHFQGWVGSQKFPFWHVHPIRGLHTCARAEPSYSSVPDGNMFVWTTNPIQIAMIREKASRTKEKLLRRPHNPRRLQTTMATASASFSMLGWVGRKKATPRHKMYTVMAQQQQQQQQAEVQQQQQQQNPPPQQQQQANAQRQPPVSEPLQPMAKSKNMFREYGGQWLSSVTRHVRIYAAYIDPVTNAFDQTQMDKLTLILDPTNEFVWTPETCNKVYAYFQELVDHYEGAPLTEYTLRLIGSDIEHYIRKMLYDGEIKYNMNAQTLNFSMGKPRVIFKNNQTENVP